MSMIDSGCKVLAVEAEKTILYNNKTFLIWQIVMVLLFVLLTKNL